MLLRKGEKLANLKVASELTSLFNLKEADEVALQYGLASQAAGEYTGAAEAFKGLASEKYHLCALGVEIGLKNCFNGVGNGMTIQEATEPLEATAVGDAVPPVSTTCSQLLSQIFSNDSDSVKKASELVTCVQQAWANFDLDRENLIETYRCRGTDSAEWEKMTHAWDAMKGKDAEMVRCVSLTILALLCGEPAAALHNIVLAVGELRKGGQDELADGYVQMWCPVRKDDSKGGWLLVNEKEGNITVMEESFNCWVNCLQAQHALVVTRRHHKNIQTVSEIGDVKASNTKIEADLRQCKAYLFDGRMAEEALAIKRAQSIARVLREMDLAEKRLCVKGGIKAKVEVTIKAVDETGKQKVNGQDTCGDGGNPERDGGPEAVSIPRTVQQTLEDELQLLEARIKPALTRNLPFPDVLESATLLSHVSTSNGLNELAEEINAIASNLNVKLPVPTGIMYRKENVVNNEAPLESSSSEMVSSTPHDTAGESLEEVPEAMVIFEEIDKLQAGVLTNGDLKKYLKQQPWAAALTQAEDFHWKDLFEHYGGPDGLAIDRSQFRRLYSEKLSGLLPTPAGPVVGAGLRPQGPLG